MPGEIYATTLAEIIDHELHTRLRLAPNDFFLWGPTVMADNNAIAPDRNHHGGARDLARVQGRSDQNLIE